MIRAVLGLAAAAALLSAAIVMAFDRPPLQPARAVPADVEVTRADAAGLLPAGPTSDAAALRRTALALGALSGQTSDAATVTAGTTDGRNSPPAPAAREAAPDARAAAAAAPGPTTTLATTDALRRALIEAIAEGRSDAEIGALIAAAREIPGVVVPERLMTARGLLETARYDAANAASHTVEPGDTLRSIAARHYGTPEAWMRIVEANASTFARNGQLTVGQILTLPD